MADTVIEVLVEGPAGPPGREGPQGAPGPAAAYVVAALPAEPVEGALYLIDEGGGLTAHVWTEAAGWRGLIFKTSGPEWALAAGVWDDAGVWNDEEEWPDA